MSGEGFAEAGSSPLTRGKQATDRVCARGRGLIPTHAGKTCQRPGHSVGKWAHPHSRGENHDVGGGLGLFNGSSPLTRGKPDLTMEDATALGLIPTHAGKTPPHSARMAATRAHPHSRGENRVHASRFHRD